MKGEEDWEGKLEKEVLREEGLWTTEEHTDNDTAREEGKEKALHVCQMVDRSLWFFDKTRPCKLRRSANIRHPDCSKSGKEADN